VWDTVGVQTVCVALDTHFALSECGHNAQRACGMCRVGNIASVLMSALAWTCGLRTRSCALYRVRHMTHCRRVTDASPPLPRGHPRH